MASKLIDEQLKIMAGINPSTGKKSYLDPKCQLKENIRRQLRIQDEQVAVNRYKWYNLPAGLDGQLIERILYYKGQGAFFFMEANGQFYFLPYALSGSVDVYGRFMGITPLQFAGGTTSNAEGKEKPWINGLIKKPIYEIPIELTSDIILDGCVLLTDYSKQLGETIIPRQTIQEPLLDAMAEAIPMARTNLLSNSGVRGIRVQGEDDSLNVINASKTIESAALNGYPYVPIQANTEFQELAGNNALKSEEYLLYMQALDNYRLSLYGLSTGGLFQKKSHMLEAEQDMNAGHAKLAYDDGLTIRQRFCDILNSIWGFGTYCLPAESVIAADMNGDGIALDELDQSGMPGDQPIDTGSEE